MTITAPAPVSTASRAQTDVHFVEIPPRTVLAIDRSGDPGGPDGYPAAIQTLYPVAYTLKFGLKDRGTVVRIGMPEGLFSVDGGDPDAFVTGPKVPTSWQWSAILEVPDEVTQEDLMAAVETIRAKARGKRARPLPPLLDEIRLERFDEGRVAEVLHIGPYEAEAPTIARLHEAIRAAGLRMRGRHHEIYLGDPRRTGPEKLKTIIRQPVE